MMDILISAYCHGLKKPEIIKKTSKSVKAIRNAFEHIEDRAVGRITRRKKSDDKAFDIFTQPDFMSKSIIRYDKHEINFETDVLEALIECRETIIESLIMKSATTK